MEGPRLRARGDDARADERLQEPVEGEAEPRRHLQVPDVGRDAEPPVQGLDGEVAHVALGRRVADEPRPLPRPRRPGLLVHRRHLGPEARHRVGDAGLLQLVDVADGPHRAVRAVAAAGVVGALVDLQVRALLVPRLLEEVRHPGPPSARRFPCSDIAL